MRGVLCDYPDFRRAVHRAIAGQFQGEEVTVAGPVSIRGVPMAWEGAEPVVGRMDPEEVLGDAFSALEEVLDQTWNAWAHEVRRSEYEHEEAEVAHHRAYHLGMREALGILLQAGAASAGRRVDSWDAVRNAYGKRWAAPAPRIQEGEHDA